MPIYPPNEREKRAIKSVKRKAFEFNTAETADQRYIVTRSLRSYGYTKTLEYIADLDITPRLNSFSGKPHTILDLGCGTGEALKEARHWLGPKGRYVGITASLPEVIPDGIEIYQSDVQNLNKLKARKALGLEDNSIDTIFAVQVSQYLEDPWAMMEGIYALLRKGGEAYICGFPSKLVQPSDREKLWNYLQQFGIKLLVGQRGPAAENRQVIHISKPANAPQTLEVPIIIGVTTRRPRQLTFALDETRVK